MKGRHSARQLTSLSNRQQPLVLYPNTLTGRYAGVTVKVAIAARYPWAILCATDSLVLLLQFLIVAILFARCSSKTDNTK